jgi:hypothetical protein
MKTAKKITMSDCVLTSEQIRDLETLGHTRTRAFTAEDALQMQDIIWHRLGKHGVLRDDPATWPKSNPPKLSKKVRSRSIFKDAISEEFLGAMDQLLGEGEWERPNDWGMVLTTFPETGKRPWDVESKGSFHWHLNPRRNGDRIRDVFSFNFLSSVKPQGGGTFIIEGSHHVVRKYLSELTPEQRARPLKPTKDGFNRYHPWLTELANKDAEGCRRHFTDPTDVHGFQLRVVELTGEPGDAVITDAGVLHAKSRNCLDRPRFMRAVPIRARGYQQGFLLDDE